MLKCSFTECNFTTSATLKKCKARKQIKQHEEKHKKEEKELLKTEEEHTSDVVGADSADVDPEVGEAITPQHTPGEEDIADGRVDGPEIIGGSVKCCFFKFESPDDVLPDMECNVRERSSII